MSIWVWKKMKEELDKQLCEKYPKIFRDRYAPMTETCMCWGIECGSGWYQVIDSLCGQIQSHIDWSHKSNAIDLEWNEKHPENQREVRPIVEQVIAVQVKEKFGGLRFYYDGGDDMIDGMVRMAESWAACSCETCGKPGSLRRGGWLRTLCDEHHEEREKKYDVA